MFFVFCRPAGWDFFYQWIVVSFILHAHESESLTCLLLLHREVALLQRRRVIINTRVTVAGNQCGDGAPQIMGGSAKSAHPGLKQLADLIF